VQQQPAAQPLPFYVETRPNDPQPSLKLARMLAGREQQLHGIQRSLRILQGGEVVDLKRF
jgi:hypothetical protein